MMIVLVGIVERKEGNWNQITSDTHSRLARLFAKISRKKAVGIRLHQGFGFMEENKRTFTLTGNIGFGLSVCHFHV